MPYIYNVKIIRNSFENSDIGIDAERVLKLDIQDNTFTNVENPILQSDCKEVVESNNRIKNLAR